MGNGLIIVCLVAIALAIFIGWKFKINIGLIAMVFAWIVGAMVMKIRVNDLVKSWPTNIIFFIITVSLFFNFALQNGTLDVISNRLLRMVRGKAWAVPWMIFFIGAIISMLGAGGATVALMAPIGFTMCAATGQSPVLVAMACGLAGQLGSDNPFNGQVGVIALGLIEGTGVASDMAFLYALRIWAYSAFKQVLVFAILYVIFKGYKGKDFSMNEPAKEFTSVHKKTLLVTLIAMLVIVIPKVINTYAPNPTWKFISGLVEPQIVMVAASVVLILMKVGDERKAIKALPVNTILLIAGVTMLMSVAKEAGLIDVLSAWVSTNLPAWLVIPAMVAIAGFLSLFSGGISVVCPVLFPMIPGIAAATGLSASALFSATYVGAMSTSSSPFSTGGGQTLGIASEEIKDKVFYGMLFSTFLCWAICIVFGLIGGFNILG